MNKLPTPHIAAESPDAFAKTVLMPGDPLRSKYIAENFLEDPMLVNNTRGVQGYTGTYKGKRVSVMASGMGIPSIGIYSYELFNFYNVDTIIRVGSAGAISPELHLRDVVFGMGACTNSAYARQYCLPGDFAPIADYGTLAKAVAAAEKLGVKPCRVAENGRACDRDGERRSLYERSPQRQKSPRDMYDIGLPTCKRRRMHRI